MWNADQASSTMRFWILENVSGLKTLSILHQNQPIFHIYISFMPLKSVADTISINKLATKENKLALGSI